MHFLLKLSSSAIPDLNFWVSKLSKNSVLVVQMTCWMHRWLSPCVGYLLAFTCLFHFQMGRRMFHNNHPLIKVYKGQYNTQHCLYTLGNIDET